MSKSLKSLLTGIPTIAIIGDGDCNILHVTSDSRTVSEGTLFAAVKGTQVDGHQFIEKAITMGAKAILLETLPETTVEGVTYIQVESVPAELGKVASHFYDNAQDELIIVGCTGTNGKTTVTTLLHDLFQYLGYKCGLLSTVEYRIGTEIFPSTHTTPDSISIHKLFKKMVDEGCTHCFMEVSSHAVDQKRISGIQFKGGIFTNITHDHLDYHKTFDNYIKAKKAFFDTLGPEAFSLTNKDDKNGMVMLQNTKSTRYTYSLHGGADFNVKIIESDFSGMQIKLQGEDIWTPLVGKFNAYNLLAVYAAATLITEGLEEISVAMSALGRVNGRFEAINGPEGRAAIIDYAHTPDALENVIQTIKNIQKGDSQLICVVGCGGDRDREKRPVMGHTASSRCDKVIFTSDNPRSESPEAIISDMMTGVEPQNQRKVLKITDRSEAIKTALFLSQPGDVILIAGKGHETYQEIKGVKHDFDDKKITQNLFKILG